ncbi:MAG: adenylosuccinate lyase [Nitrospiria bacterium]
MIDRYALPKMKALWGLEHKYQTWLRIEILVLEALARHGLVPKRALSKVKSRIKVEVETIAEIERVVKHDVVAFLTAVSRSVGPEGRYLHWGLTSSDILDTSLAILMKEAAEIILDGLAHLLKVIGQLADRHKETLMIGRSHGVHGEPITFGLKMAIWYEETKRNIQRMEEAKEVISVGKISGSMGTFAHLDPEVEAHVCSKCGLKPAPVSSQIIQRDRHAQYLTALAILASSIDKFAMEIRHLQRTEVLEVEEPFSEGQKGSSSMPHKRNPIGCENLSGLARVVRANALAGLENIALWHERDISHSSVERIIIPDSTILVDFMLNRFIGILRNLQIYPERMRSNLGMTRGLIYSQKLLMALVEKGLSREKAYEAVQRNAMKAWRDGDSFEELTREDPLIRKALSLRELKSCFDPKDFLKHLDEIYKRVFG